MISLRKCCCRQVRNRKKRDGIDFLHFLYREISRFCPQNVLSYAGKLQFRVRPVLPADAGPMRQEGWISELGPDGAPLTEKTDVCAHRLWRPPALRRYAHCNS